jgi:hypothetical protein
MSGQEQPGRSYMTSNCLLAVNVQHTYIKMKVILILSLFLLPARIFAQQIINGGMESWDTTSVNPYPDSWLNNTFYAQLPCYPPLVTAEQTSDSKSGNWAVRLEAKECIDDLSNPQVYIGFLAYGNTGNPQLAHGIPYTWRPGELQFYYKFLPAGTDTGFAKVLLRRYDSSGGAGAVVGEGRASIINTTSVYTPLSVPIIYYLPDTPEFIQIVFATSKTIASPEYFSLNTAPGNGAHSGTTLWIDDVALLGGTIGIFEPNETEIAGTYPNPVTDKMVLTVQNFTPETAYSIYDITGRQVASGKVESESTQLQTSFLNPGIYVIKITGKTSGTIKFIKQ